MAVFDTSNTPRVHFPVLRLPLKLLHELFAVKCDLFVFGALFITICWLIATLFVLLLFDWFETRVEWLFWLHESALKRLLIFLQPIQYLLIQSMPKIIQHNIISRPIFLGRPRPQLIIRQLAIAEPQEQILICLQYGIFNGDLVEWHLELHLVRGPLLFVQFVDDCLHHAVHDLRLLYGPEPEVVGAEQEIAVQHQVCPLAAAEGLELALVHGLVEVVQHLAQLRVPQVLYDQL